MDWTDDLKRGAAAVLACQHDCWWWHCDVTSPLLTVTLWRDVTTADSDAVTWRHYCWQWHRDVTSPLLTVTLWRDITTADSDAVTWRHHCWQWHCDVTSRLLTVTWHHHCWQWHCDVTSPLLTVTLWRDITTAESDWNSNPALPVSKTGGLSPDLTVLV